MKYDVFDNEFTKVGEVQADSAADALIAAKKKFKFVPAPMVQESDPDLTPDLSRAVAAHRMMPRKH